MDRSPNFGEILMKSEYLVLRSSRLATRDVFANPAALGAPTPTDVRVEMEDLNRRDIPLVTRDADVLAVAPVMPMKLVEPVLRRATVAGEAGDVAWGVKAVRADTSRCTGKGIVVAVLDTGIQADHPAFQGVTLIQRNFTNEADTDQHGHGTHCAGTIFGRSVAGTRIGVAHGVSKALIGKVLGSGGGSSKQIVNAILWAVDNGAHIISMSLGMDFPGLARRLRERDGFPEELAVSRALEGYRANVLLFERLASLIRAQANRSILIAAAGNESRRRQDPRFEIAVAPPAVADGVVSVAAVGRSDSGLAVADFSNTGANICGPGVDIASAGLAGGLLTMSGTSMAAPHVAGVAALWAERLAEVGSFNALNLTAKLIGQASFNDLGAGIDPFDVGAGLVLAPQP